MKEPGFTDGRNSIVIRQIRVGYETEIPGKVNWCQINIRSKWTDWTRMNAKFEKLLWPADEKKLCRVYLQRCISWPDPAIQCNLSGY